MKNLEIIEDIVGTQYNDMEGLISIDGHLGDMFFNMCSDYGIDMDKFFLIGFGLYDSFSQAGKDNDEVSCKVILLNKKEYGDSYDEIKSKIQNLESVNAVCKYFYIKYTDLQKYIKRISFMTISSMGDNISKLNIIKED